MHGFDFIILLRDNAHTLFEISRTEFAYDWLSKRLQMLANIHASSSLE